MTDQAHAFTCVDCGVHVVTFGGGGDRERCYNCTFVNHMELPPQQEAELRQVLGCERREADE